MLYTAVPITYLTGVYRLLGAKNFSKEIGIGFGLDIFFTLALFFLQGLNNATLTASSVEKQLIAAGSFQQISILIKIAALLDITFELIIFLYEVYRLHQLSKQSIDVVVRYNEEKRRAVYASKYLKLSTITLSVGVVFIIIISVLLPTKGCLEK